VIGLFGGIGYEHFSPKIFPVRGMIELDRSGPSAVSEEFSSASSDLEKAAEVLRSPDVLLAAINRLKDLHPGLLAGDQPVADLRKQLKVWIHPQTRQVEMGLDSPFPHEAAAILNAIIGSFPAANRSVADPARMTEPDLSISKIRPASPDVAPEGWPTLFFALAGSDAGFVFGLLLFVMTGAAAEKVRDEDRLTVVSDLPVTGRLPRLPKQRSWIGRGLTAHILPSSKAAAEIRSFMSKVTSNRPTGEFLVASPSRGEGRSTVALNLAVALAGSGHKVVLVDADLRAPTLHQVLENGWNRVGLADALADPRAACSHVQATHIPNLHILPAGEAKPGTEDQLSDVFMENVLGSLRERFRYVVIDGGPLLDQPSTVKLAARCQKTLLVLEEKRTRLGNVVAGRNLLREQGVRDISVVFNARHRADPRKKSPRPIEPPVLAFDQESELPSFDWLRQKNVA
jgi:receptor protein-tyrosine kinase